MHYTSEVSMQRSSILISTILLTAMFLLLPFNTSAQADPEQVGIVVAARGDVVAVNSSGDSRKLEIKSPVYREDIIKTGKRGRVQLMFTDNTLISLDRQSEMKIAEYEWKPDQNDGKLKTEIKEGTFRVMGGKITKVAPDKFTTETPAATIGIRGSMYAGKVAGDSLSVVFQGGKGITVTNEFGTILITKPGYGTSVTSNTAPLPSVKFTAEDLSALDGEAAETGEDNTGTDNSVNSEQSDDSQAETSSSDQTGDDQNDASAEEQTSDQSGTETSTEDSGTDGSETILAITDDTSSTSSSSAENGVSGGLDTNQPQVLYVISPDDAGNLPDTSDTSNPYQSIVEKELSLQNLPTAVSTTTPPTNGIEGFKGTVSGTGIDPDGNQVIISGYVELEVNWYTQKVLGRVFDKSSVGHDLPVYFFGDISGNQITNIRIIGPGGDASSQLPSIISGSSPYASFYGASQEAFGLYGAGTEYLITTLASQGAWTITGTGKSTGIDPSDVTAPTGNPTFNGFFVGAAEDVSAPNNNRRLFANSFNFKVDRDAGTIGNSSFVASDLNGSSLSLSLDIGGGNGSAYVLDDNFIGLASGTVTNGTSTSLKPYFNYLVTADPDKQDWFFKRPQGAKAYASWGYWEAAYVDPQNGATYHSHIPYSTWVAGRDLTDFTTPPPSATYRGGALGFHVMSGGEAFDLGQGECKLDISFSGAGHTFNTDSWISFPNPINHPAVLMDLQSGLSSTSGNPFQWSGSNPTPQPIQYVNGTTPNSSVINGAVYGTVGTPDEAREFGGNFNAKMPDGSRYMGIIGGQKE